MVTVQLAGPQWFLGVDAILEAFAALVALLVVLAAYRVYKMTCEKKYAYFTVSFGLLTLSFLSRAITNSLIEETFFTVPQHLLGRIFFIGYVIHILLALTAYLLLITITHKITDKRVIALLFIILVPSLLLSGSYFLSFYGFSTIFLAFIAAAYYKNYKIRCTGSACMVFLAFLLLCLSQAQMLLEAVQDFWYVTGHITQTAGFLLLFLALLKVTFKPRKT